MRLCTLVLAWASLLLGSCAVPESSTRTTQQHGGGTGQTPQAKGAAPQAIGLAGGPNAPATPKSLATIESVRADLVPGNPAQASVILSGLLHDGATRVQSIEQHRTAQGVEITVTTTRPAHSSVGVALIPFERTVTVDLHGLTSGACRITANGASTMLMVP